MSLDPAIQDLLRFDDAGLIPAIVQQHDTGEVLMFAWMDAEAVARTLGSGEAWFWSRSRGELWHKGATSGNTLIVHEVRVDCDEDVLLVLVDVGDGVACHTGARSCFFRRVTPQGVEPIEGVERSAPPGKPLTGR